MYFYFLEEGWKGMQRELKSGELSFWVVVVLLLLLWLSKT